VSARANDLTEAQKRADALSKHIPTHSDLRYSLPTIRAAHKVASRTSRSGHRICCALPTNYEMAQDLRLQFVPAIFAGCVLQMKKEPGGLLNPEIERSSGHSGRFCHRSHRAFAIGAGSAMTGDYAAARKRTKSFCRCGGDASRLPVYRAKKRSTLLHQDSISREKQSETRHIVELMQCSAPA